jgi:ActR/RegA family two-component response regulator
MPAPPPPNVAVTEQRAFPAPQLCENGPFRPEKHVPAMLPANPAARRTVFYLAAAYGPAVSMKGLSKVLLLKNHREHPLARSWIVDEGGLHGRTISDSGALHTALQREKFDVIVIDQRDSDDDLLETLTGIREFQAESRLLVLSGKIALPQVVQAMRFGVRGIFQPPVDISEFILRVHADATGEPVHTQGRDDQEITARWGDLAKSLEGAPPIPKAGELAPTPAPVPTPASHPPPPPAGPSPETLQELTSLRTALEEQRRETELLRRKLEEAHAAHAKLTTEVDRLINQATAVHVESGSRVQQLEKELAHLKRENTRKTEHREVAGAEPRAAELERQLDAALKRIRTFETTPQEHGNGATAAAVLAAQKELELHISTAARLQEQLAQAMVAKADLTHELARLGGIEARAHRYEAELSVVRLAKAQETDRARAIEQQLHAARARLAEIEARDRTSPQTAPTRAAG